MVSGRSAWESPAVQAPGEEGPGHDSRTAGAGLAAGYRAEHPQTGRTDRGSAVGDPLKYVIVIERAADGGYGAWAPDLPGCVALGDTVEDTEREMREAIAFHLEGMRADGEPIPQPAAVTATVVEIEAA